MYYHTRFFSFVGLLSIGLMVSSCQGVPKSSTFENAASEYELLSRSNYVFQLPINNSYYAYQNIKNSTLIPNKVDLPPSLITSVKNDIIDAVSSEQIAWQFSLQIASVNNKENLSTSLDSLKNKAPNLFQGQFITNVETAKVQNTDVYRLKFGAYKYYKNALADCQTFKSFNVDCLVSNYTDTPYHP